ncbi:hypothetical protein NQ314_015183 [Rhamnusium bicolor]|uniref:Pre-mRNA-splicing factor ISY1 n=1 Tax=Rhamnusium bicolor TaxID=1586634 RepID=A0AAV8WYX2_9CUCU|nr:hypothetical protein NQ314_015183 [Rhamnusium bicolor]
MARNAEKAMTTLARWRAAQLGETEKHKKRRPYLASEFAQIQNAGLGEFRIRDLNDEINKLLREKRHWEDQIKELGGPDYQRVGPRMLDHEGKEVPGNRGYKYFGAAKELPELMKDIDADYYGYMDDDDGILIPLELRAEKSEKKEQILNKDSDVEQEEEENIYAVEESDEEDTAKQVADGSQQRFVAHVPVPSQQDIEQALLKRRKQELLEKYGVQENQSI